MFVDKLEASYPWPVLVPVPERGKFTKRQLVLRFYHFGVDELRALVAGPEDGGSEELLRTIREVLDTRPDNSPESAAQAALTIAGFVLAHRRGSTSNDWLFPRIIAGWEGVTEEDGKTPRPYSYEALKALLNKYRAWELVSEAWTESLKVGREKN